MDDGKLQRSSFERMMICHDHIESETRCELEFLDVVCSTVHSDQQTDTFSMKTPHRLAIEPVPFLQSMGNIRASLDSEFPQSFDENRRSADSIDVIVTINADLSLLSTRLEDQIDRPLQIGDQFRGVKVEETRSKEGLGVCFGTMSPLPEKSSHRKGHL